MTKITVQDTDISIVKYNEEDYISLTDMARSQMQEHIIFRWLSLKSTIEYLGEWDDGIRDNHSSRGLGEVYKRQVQNFNYF